MGKLFFYVALALVLVSGVLFAPETAGLAIHPMDQFTVTPLFGGDHIAWYTPTNVTLWMFFAVVAVFALLVFGSANRGIVPSRAQSVAELAYGFIYKMVEDVAKQGRGEVLPLHHHIVHVHRDRQLPWPDPDVLYHNVAFRRHRPAGGRGLRSDHHHRLRAAWCQVSRPVLGQLRSAGAASGPRPDRSDFLLRAPRQPLHSTCRQRDGGTRGSEGVRRICLGALGAASFLPIFAITAFYALEVLVAFIQAYVFTILTCVYLKDALHPSH